MGLGEGILLDWWRDFTGLVEGSVPDGFNTLRGWFQYTAGWFQYTAGMVSIHCRDGFILTLGWFYPNSGMVLSQLWEGFFQPKGC